MTARTMNINQATEYIERHNLFLHYDDRVQVELWTVGRQMPLSLRRSVYKNRATLHRRLREGDARLCPAKRLHWHSWRRVGQKIRCGLCRQLDNSMLGRQSDAIAS
jgi:hypothetical protein